MRQREVITTLVTWVCILFVFFCIVNWYAILSYLSVTQERQQEINTTNGQPTVVKRNVR